MKKLQLMMIALGFITALAACRGLGKRHTTIIENGNGFKVKIEYLGQAYFNSEGTAIKSISPNGYVKYTRDDKTVTVEGDSNGEVSYELNNGDKQTVLNEADKAFLAQAVKDMIKYGHNADGRQK